MYMYVHNKVVGEGIQRGFGENIDYGPHKKKLGPGDQEDLEE